MYMVTSNVGPLRENVRTIRREFRRLQDGFQGSYDSAWAVELKGRLGRMEEPEESQDAVTEYKAMIEVNAWSDFNKVRESIDNFDYGARRKSKRKDNRKEWWIQRVMDNVKDKIWNLLWPNPFGYELEEAYKLEETHGASRWDRTSCE